MLTQAEQKKAAKDFARRWEGVGYEKGDSARFWLSLLHEVYGVEKPAEFIRFEERVKMDHTSYIDGYIPTTHVLIEQKSMDKDLTKAIRQSDGTLLSPFQQAKRYSAELPYSERPRWIVTCNFKEFFIYDMEKPSGEPEIVLLSELEDDYYRMFFLVDEGDENIKKEMEVSLKAGELVGVLYAALLKEYHNPEDEQTLRYLNVLCVRLVFCFYAEDAGLFGPHGIFHDYLRKYRDFNFRDALIKLFRVLDQKPEERDPYLEDDLAQFPYVNGELFEDEEIVIPRINDEIIDIILNQATSNFDWSNISPTIFGGVFESTLNPETRRSGGMHYTSIKNIRKVIDPLFMNDLNEEFQKIQEFKTYNVRKRKLEEFQEKLASLKFLDPAAGSGNFLTETYLSLRRLENKVIKLLYGGQIVMGLAFNPIKVSIGQFYGIEINDFAVTVAKTALWIAESQMFKETQDIIHSNIDFLPLESYSNIVEGNALRMDWEDVIASSKLDYIMGNPPFIGFTYMSKNQKSDMKNIFPKIKNLDYVSCWFKLSSDFIQGSNIDVGFVATSSITEGETISRLWSNLEVKINYAYQSFKWESEAKQKASVYCVIIGFSKISSNTKWIYSNDIGTKVKNINSYLIDGPDVLVTSRNKPICNVSKMIYGNKPADGGNLIIEDSEYKNFIFREPQAKKFIRPLLGAAEFLRNKRRWCLWLVGADPSELRKCPLVLQRVEACKKMRENSVASGIRKFSLTPTLFAQITQPANEDYILIPRVSSEKRKYVPMGFLKKETIVTDAVQIVPKATIYEFGILTSNVHMSWMRRVCGRLKSDYRYSKDIVYNNFPWPTPSDFQKTKIEKTAQAILDARGLYPDSSLADLYDELTMPAELRKAHQENDKAVMESYGFDWKNMSESECVAELMKMYEELTS